ncbi:RHS repeat-associated core domain-containing protein [Pseudomonas sp. LB3P81]
MAYSPYGWQSAQLELKTGLGFNGDLREVKSQWYVLGKGYRVYNPRLMRFHSPDSLSPFDLDQRNAYAYCGGEPVRRSDPTGHFPIALLKPWFNKFLGGLRATVNKTASTAISTVSDTSKMIYHGASHGYDVLARSKTSVSNYLFGSEPFPVPPPRFKKSASSNSPNYLKSRPDSVRGQQGGSYAGTSPGRVHSQNPVTTRQTSTGGRANTSPTTPELSTFGVRSNYLSGQLPRSHTAIAERGTGDTVAVIRTGLRSSN